MWARCSATCFSGIPTRPESSWAVCRPSRSWRRSASRTVIERSAGGRSRRGAATPPVYCTLDRSAADLQTIGTALLEGRHLMEADPHRLLEGMLAAYAAGASRGMLSRRARRRRRRPRHSSERSLRSTLGNPAARARSAARERLGCWTSSTASRGRRQLRELTTWSSSPRSAASARPRRCRSGRRFAPAPKPRASASLRPESSRRRPVGSLRWGHPIAGCGRCPT